MGALPPSPLLVKGVFCLRLRQTSPEVSPCKTQRRECEEDPVGPRTVEHDSPPLEVFLLRCETSSQSQSRVPSPKEVCRRIVSLRLPGGFPPGSPVSTQHQKLLNFKIFKDFISF